MGNTGSFAGFRADVNDPRRGPDGLLWAGVVGGVQDTEATMLRAALLAHYPAQVPDDGLDALGNGAYGLPRYPDEDNATYRARLVAAWQIYSLAGSPKGVIDSLNAWGLPDVAIFASYQAAFGPGWQNSDYSEFWPWLGPGYGSTGIGPLLWEVPPWDSGWTWDSTATRDQIVAIKQQVLRWKAVHGYPVRIFLVFGAGNIGPLWDIGFLPQPPNVVGLFWDSGWTWDENPPTSTWIVGKTWDDTIGGWDGFTWGGYVV